MRKIDETVPNDVLWQFLPTEGEFIVSGKSERLHDQYIINLYDGTILKNGCLISGVPTIIKTS